MRALAPGLVVAALAGACAHAPDLPVRLDPAPPAGSTTEVVTAPDGVELYARHWAPAEAPRAVVVVMHGLKDHSGRYAGFASQLAAAGYSVYAFDLRGHGRSSGPRVAPGRWWDYVDDLDRFLAGVEVREPGRPVFVLGHSMGGTIAAGAAIQHRPPVAGLILSAPALVIDGPPILLGATRLLGALAPRAPALRLPDADFSSTPGAAEALRADPLIAHAAGPARTAAGLVEGIRRIWAGAPTLDLPVLALHGTRDRLTAPAGSRLFVETIASRDRTLRVYEGLFHDLLHEPDGAQVAGDIRSWLDAHTGGAPVTPPPPYGGRLAGDPHGAVQAGAIAVGAAFGDDGDELVADLSVRLARARPIGWHGAFIGRWTGELRALTAAPVGIAARLGTARAQGVFGVATGIAALSGAPRIAVPATAWLELSLGPVHATASAELAYRVGGAAEHDGPLASDFASAELALRPGGDRVYWPGAVAGVGPVLAFGITSAGARRALTVTVGLALYGAN